MTRAKRKPHYRSTAGAYSTSPRLLREADGAFTSAGSIEAWRGSVEDLLRVAEAGRTALAERTSDRVTVTTVVTLWSGRTLHASSLDAFLAAAKTVDEADISALRIEARTAMTTAVVVARRTIPGVVVSVSGPDRFEVDGLVRLMFAEAMRGYVDRYGGIWRPTASFATAAVPGAFMFALVVRLAEVWPDWATVLVALAALAVGFLILINSWQWTLLRTPLVLVADLDARPGTEVRMRFRAFFERRLVARICALAGVVLLSIVANKLSDLIPWP